MARQARTVEETPLLGACRPAASSYTQETAGQQDDTQSGVNASRYSGLLSDADYLRRQRYATLCRRNRSARSDPPPILMAQFQASDDLPLEAQLDIYDSIVEQQDMVENVRAQPWPMHIKIRYVRQLKDSINEKKQYLGKLDTISHKSLKAIDQATKTVDSWNCSLTIWENSINLVEGYFGSGVGAYFYFLRRVFFLNLLLALFILLPFVVVPQIASGKGTRTDSYLSRFENTFIFYGYYDTGSLEFGYNMSVAFLVCNVVFFVFSFLYILRRMSGRYRSAKLSGLHDDFPFCWLAFVAWDCGISTEKGAHSKQAAVATLIKEELRESKEEQKRRSANMCRVMVRRFISNLIVLGCLGGSAYVVYRFVERSEQRKEYNSNVFIALLERFELSLVLLALRLVVPIFFEKLVLIEHWHPRTALKWTLVRTTTFYLGNVVVLVLSLLREATTDTCALQTNSTNAPTTAVPTAESREYLCCWETYVGLEISKVVFIDFLGEIASVLVTDVIRALFVIYVCGQRRIGYHEFDIASNVLGLIYGQSLIWLGTFFCPLLPALQVVKLLIVFYMRRVAVVYTNVAPKKIFRASRSGNFLHFLLLFMLFVCTIPFGYTVASLQPSTECGPFRTESRIYKVLVHELPSWASSVLQVITSPAFTIPVITLLLLVIFYYKVTSSSYRDVIKDLHAQLHFERQENWTTSEINIRRQKPGHIPSLKQAMSTNTKQSVARY